MSVHKPWEQEIVTIETIGEDNYHNNVEAHHAVKCRVSKNAFILHLLKQNDLFKNLAMKKSLVESPPGMVVTKEIAAAWSASKELATLKELLQRPRMLELYDELNVHCGTMMGTSGGMLLQIRGWGHLTGQGACALPEAEAAAIQDAFSDWLVTLLNHVKGKA